MSTPHPSVIICCYSVDRLADSVAAAGSVSRQTLAPHEIIVSVDNNPSLAQELALALPREISVLQNNAVRGLSETRNVAIREASGEVVAFIDDDATAEPDWLEQLMLPFAQPDVMAVGGRSVPAWERGVAPRWFPREYEFIIGCSGHMDFLATETGEVRNVTGSNMAFRRRVFDTVGEWKRELGRGQVKTGGEEAELCLRIRSAIPGARILYEPAAVVHHKVSRQRATLNYVFTYAYHEGVVRSQLAVYLAEHTGKPLAGEWRFLRRLLDTAIPGRLRRIRHLESALQLGVIVTNTALLGTGYLRGRLSMVGPGRGGSRIG